MVANIHKREREEKQRNGRENYDQEVILEQPTSSITPTPFSLLGHRRKETIMVTHALDAAPHLTFTLPISLNSLDREGVRLLSPHDSQITSKPACRCRGYRADDATQLKEELDGDLVLCVVSF